MSHQTVAAVVSGNAITATWGNSVATAIGELETTNPVYMTEFPGGNVDATTSGSFVTWITVDTVTIPTWCTSCIIHLDICNVTCITAAALYSLDATTNGGSYAVDRGVVNFTAASELNNFSFTAPVTSPATGSQTVLLGAKRVSGTGQMRATSTTKITGYIYFLG